MTAPAHAQPASATATPSPATLASNARVLAWLDGPVRGSTFRRWAIATIRSTNRGYQLRIPIDVSMSCRLEFDSDGHPSRLTQCEMPRLTMRSGRIALRCAIEGATERCVGGFTFDSQAWGNGGDRVVISRALRPSEIVVPAARTAAQIIERAESWVRGPVTWSFDASSNWSARVRRVDTSLVLEVDPLANVSHCRFEFAPDGDPQRLFDCAGSGGSHWVLAQRQTRLRCSGSGSSVRCHGSLAWRSNGQAFPTGFALRLSLPNGRDASFRTAR